jgi:hypothetical protein
VRHEHIVVGATVDRPERPSRATRVCAYLHRANPRCYRVRRARGHAINAVTVLSGTPRHTSMKNTTHAPSARLDDGVGVEGTRKGMRSVGTERCPWNELEVRGLPTPGANLDIVRAHFRFRDPSSFEVNRRWRD